MARSPLRKTVYVGTFVHTPRCGGGLEVLEGYGIAVDETGVIRAVQQVEDVGKDGRQSLRAEVLATVGWRGEECDVEFIGVGEDESVVEWVAPGFVDTHTHAPQLPNTGIFGSSTLLSWLRTYTFPLESSFSSLSTAHRIYSRCIASLLRHGTTTAAYYATIHVPATNLLASLAHAAGQRAFIGRVCMDREGVNEDHYRDETPDAGLQHTHATIAHCESLDKSDDRLVQPILTPRFAPSCSDRMLALLGTLAHEQPSLRVQTHIAENHAELALVRELYPAHRDYASVYDSAGLLTPRTVLAHTIHLSDAEVALIKERGCGVAHCPVSNTALASGICPVRKLLDRGIKVGLGTDVSGGCSCSILVAMREACGVSRLLAAMEKEDDDGRREKCKLSVLEALWLATRGGAEVMGLGDKVGAFEVGMEWDAQVIRVVKVPKGGESTTTGEDMKIGKPGVDEGLVELWSNEDWEEKISKWVYCGDDRNTRKVWVRGRCVYER